MSTQKILNLYASGASVSDVAKSVGVSRQRVHFVLTRAKVVRKKPTKAPWEPSHPGFVYFIKAGDNGPVKIGHTKSIITRVMAYEIHCFEPVKMVAGIRGDKFLEARFHNALSHLRVNGEWFHLNEELESIICSIRNHTFDPESLPKYDKPRCMAPWGLNFNRMTPADIMKIVQGEG